VWMVQGKARTLLLRQKVSSRTAAAGSTWEGNFRSSAEFGMLSAVAGLGQLTVPFQKALQPELSLLL